jgi:hypothetical protein
MGFIFTIYSPFDSFGGMFSAPLPLSSEKDNPSDMYGS